MSKKELTFDTLPQDIQNLIIKVNNIEHSLEMLKPQQLTPAEDKLLTVKEAAALLNLKVPTIYSKVSRGELPHSKVGKRLYFSKTELTAYIQSGKVLSNEEIEHQADAYMSNSKKSS